MEIIRKDLTKKKMFIQFDCFLFDEKTQHIHSKISN